MKNILTSLCVALLLSAIARAQSKTLNGVYAGVRVTPGVVMGGGMTREDVVVYFRPDGSFTYDLHKADWQTRSDGKYTIQGNNLTLNYQVHNRTIRYKLDKDGDIDADGCTLLKMPVDGSVPKGYFKFSIINSSGGGSSPVTYVGAAKDQGLLFDGKGGFSSNSASATVISGNGVGGGSSRESSGKGTYTIHKGVLSLKYENGKTAVHSFFCRPGDPVMAVIDGNIYFMEEPPKAASRNTAATGNARQNNTGPAATPVPETADGKTLLLKANAVHGGAALNQVKTFGFTALLQGLNVRSIADVAGNRVRIEMRKGNQLVQVEQLEGNAGWQWKQGKTGTLSAVRAAEMMAVFHAGVLGLRKQEIEALAIKEVKPAKAGYSVHGGQQGKQYLFLLNNESQLMAAGDNTGNVLSTSVYSNWKKVDGLLLPFTEAVSAGGQKATIQYQQYEINTAYPETVWAKP
ncbi:hypothetical protein HNQ91_001752 [Filimonas zeae]|uniref:Uncharacterized protein n=1 Tax=Filimonas zeae TaxID=1737353 RepID=A0A917MVZ8_9BACT|nr:hypothetical protein [Filimonas zeae]MDR6338701.1 hypothetical protein [Filimonas zeae]GGH66991.1 hypothetical protein GCM10011379_21760 [Filimonas zeae]